MTSAPRSQTVTPTDAVAPSGSLCPESLVGVLRTLYAGRHTGVLHLRRGRDHLGRRFVWRRRRRRRWRGELNEAADAGFRFEGVMGGDTSFGGTEIVSILSRSAGGPAAPRYQYKLLATNKTGTMQREMGEAAAAGFVYRGQTVADTTFGGREVIVIMERDRDSKEPSVEYKLLATNKTGTMQKELSEAAEAGYRYRGVTVARTTFGGNEVVVITDRSLGAR
jgi:hypothetical protein